MNIDEMKLFVREGRNTGPGECHQYLDRKDGIYLLDNYRFYNYNIDGNQLKYEHQRVIHKYIVPLLRTRRCHLIIRAFASKSGDAEYNRQLSISRALHCKKYFSDLGFSEAQIPGSEMRAYGEPNYEHKGSEWYRAVHLMVETGLKLEPYPYIIPPLIIPPPPPPQHSRFPPAVIPGKKPQGSTNWWIKYKGGVSVGVGAYSAGVQKLNHKFLLWDGENKMMYVGEFDGGGASVSPPVIPFPVSGAYTPPGSRWCRVYTGRRVASEDFEGNATWNENLMPGTPHRVNFKNAGAASEVSTGPTIGIPSGNANWGKVKVTRGMTGYRDHP
jgi:hypothetical protein